MHRTHDLRLAHALAEGRRRRMRRTSLLVQSRHERRIVRRWIGRRLVSLGSRLANEPTMQPARAR